MDPNDITTDHDITSLLQSCSACKRHTHNATFVLTHTQLPEVHLRNIRQRNIGLIVNSESSNRLGHWFTLLVYGGRFLLVCDGLCKALKMGDVKLNINRFCIINNLVLRDLNFRCQRSDSLKCGYIALFFIARASLLRYNPFLNTIQMLKHYSIPLREEYIFRYVKRHFTIIGR